MYLHEYYLLNEHISGKHKLYSGDFAIFFVEVLSTSSLLFDKIIWVSVN